MSGQHPRRAFVHQHERSGDRLADLITGFVGSWWCVGIHALWFVAWIFCRVEHFPFGLLTLLVSLEAVFLSTFVMLSQNRQAERDRRRDDLEAEEVETSLQLLAEVRALARDVQTHVYCAGHTTIGEESPHWQRPRGANGRFQKRSSTL
jgi:uncharacterized membrane protein